MSAKKGKRDKVPPAAADDSQKASSLDHLDSANLSAIERASFMEGLQLNYGNPLHSTAVEEDLEALEEGRVNKGRAGKKDVPAKQRGAAKKRKETETDGESEKEKQQQKKKRSTGGKVKARPVKNQQMKKDKKRKSESGKSSDPQSQEESESDTRQQRRKRVLSSDEEEVEDTSWKPSPKKHRVYSLGRTRKSSSGTPKSRKSSSGTPKSRKSSSGTSKSRKSSSGSASAEPEETNRVERKRKRRQGGTQLEEVLDAFLDFCEQYRESVESKAVKQSIDSFSNNVREQLTEKISSHKELRVLKRENAKVGSLIRTKTQRLLDAKHELMRAERQAWLLQKEKAELELRLSDLRRSHSFLRDIRELNRQYLDYRHTHPREKETYGASSLPALLLEARHIQGAEHQLRGINNQLEKRLEENVK
ncbi:centromere protein U isoform X1 [Thunnus albacares]|uniref:centromere protein U isoform X1 n=1 Tax=Thunnus albacares TaxID=8236 RepID=UPI001CF7171C|nr:centromere protein U isoform X1 [Thunnus albacares]